MKRIRQVFGEEIELLHKIPFIKRYFYSKDILEDYISFETVSRIVKALIENLCLKLYKNKKLVRKCKLRFLPHKNLIIEANFTNATNDKNKIELVVLEQLKNLRNIEHTELITLEGCLIEDLLEEQHSSLFFSSVLVEG